MDQGELRMTTNIGVAVLLADGRKLLFPTCRSFYLDENGNLQLEEVIATPVAVFAKGQWFGVFYAHIECQEVC
jgi:hypothetical protein